MMRWTDWLAVGMGGGSIAGLAMGHAPGLSAAVSLTAWAGLTAWAVVDLRVQGFVDAVCRVAPNDGQVVLTFDDGPDPETTPRVLDILNRYGVHAAFFMIGEKVAASPQIAREVRAAGHDVGSHCYRHQWMPLTRVPVAVDELRRAQGVLQDTLGEPCRYFRPPYGLTFPALGRAVRKLDLVTVGWSLRTRDAVATIAAADLAERTAQRSRAGDIVLMHDAPERAQGRLPLGPAMLQPLIVGLLAKGLRPVSLSEAVAHNAKTG